MKAIIPRLRSAWETRIGDEEPSTTDDQAGYAGERPPAGLFYCPTCDVVYLAVEKRTCSGCRGAVEEVRRTPTGN